jgi:hypothetical protein
MTYDHGGRVVNVAIAVEGLLLYYVIIVILIKNNKNKESEHSNAIL